MPTVTDSDVATGVLTRWAAVADLDGRVPAARVYRGRAPERTAVPYARLKVRERDRELTSGPAYVASFVVDVDCYIETEAGTAGPLRAALDAAFNGTGTDPAAGVTVPNATATLGSAAEPGSTSEPSHERVDGLDVVRVSASFQVTVQGDRG